MFFSSVKVCYTGLKYFFFFLFGSNISDVNNPPQQSSILGPMALWSYGNTPCIISDTYRLNESVFIQTYYAMN
jgi:hypothetical protein